MNKRRGSVFLQITVVLLFLGVLFATFYQSFVQMLVSARRMQEDMELNRVSMLLFAAMEREIAYNGAELSLGVNQWGSLLTLKHLGTRRTIAFYCRPLPQDEEIIGFYQSIKSVGKNEGVNPLIPPTVVVKNWKSEKLSNKSVRVTLELATTQGGRSKTFTDRFQLCNGRVL